ncbi:MAG: response regulator [bacterium]|nr:response regulator [bacterium]
MPKQVLIVEDEIIFSEHIRLLLQRWGYEILATVASGEEAIQALEDECPDLILMDIFLAGELDGIETTRHIRSQHDVPILYLSGCDDDEIAERLKSSVPSAYILKPINARELSINIEIALYKHQVEQKLIHLNVVLHTIRKINKLIVREKDATRLLQGVCRTFTELRGYLTPWIAISDEQKRFRLVAHAGLENQESSLKQAINDNDLPQCVQLALKDMELVIIDHLHKTCSNCPMAASHSNNAVMCVTLMYMEKFYGVLNVAIPFRFVEHTEEQLLFKELADDIAFALHSIESEEKRRGMEAELIAERVLLTRRVEERTAELSDINTRLQDEVLERRQTEHALQQAKDAAETANRAKSEFLANMSHELRTPLNAILGYAQILKNSPNFNERQQEGLNTIESSGEHLLNLINESLELSKIEAGRMELQAHEFHLPSFLEHLEKIIYIRAKQKGIRFTYRQESSLASGVRADENRLREILINLLDNAIKFTKEGEVNLGVKQIERSEGTVLPFIAPSARIRFTVQDTGGGIAPEHLGKIFSPFERLQGQAAVEGTGLGLAICQKLVRMMGGDLQVTSTVSKGSTFSFELLMPIVEQLEAPEPSYGRRIVGYTGRRRTLMVIDDNSANRAVLVGLLLPLGFEICEATNGLECLEKSVKRQVDLLLLDLRMPVLDGFGTAERLRDLEEQGKLPKFDPERATPIVAVSASVFEETKKRAKAIGFTDFLIKPIQQETLQRLLQQHLQLEWKYGESLPGERYAQDPREIVIPSSLPSRKIEELRSLASRGRIKKLLAALTEVERLDPKHQAFVREIQHLAKQFRTKEIVECLQQESHSL